MTTKKALTVPQKRVMGWMSKGWPATMNNGNSIDINGKRVCNIDTITALINAGLVEKDGQWSWKATEEGRNWTEQPTTTQKVWNLQYVAGNPSMFSRVTTAAGSPMKRSEALEGAENIAPGWRCWVEHATSGQRIFESGPEKEHRLNGL